MFAMHGVVRHYDWGSPTAIPSLVGIEPDGRPWAEVWYGDLPIAPMSLGTGAEGRVEHHDGELPYLAKLLAAEAPLSLQTHPNEQQARAGFTRENSAGVDLHAPERIYRDPSAKPEILIAISSFEALCGFRPVRQTADLLKSVGATALAERLENDGLRPTFEHIMRSPPDEAVLEACAAAAGIRQAQWAAQLGRLYPGDPAAVATLLLNYLSLTPGEAIYLAAGNIHAYLGGVGLEVMGPSDNVVRCGLTPKHIDIDEMMLTVDFQPLDEPRASMLDDTFETPGAPFRVRHRGEDARGDLGNVAFDAWFIPPDRMQFETTAGVYTVSPG